MKTFWKARHMPRAVDPKKIKRDQENHETKMATHTRKLSEPLRFLLPRPWPPRWDEERDWGEEEGTAPPQQQSMIPQTLSSSPQSPQAAPQAPPPRDVPPATMPPHHHHIHLSSAHWLHINFLEAMTLSGTLVVEWLQPLPSSPLPQTPTWGEPALSLPPISPKMCGTELTLRDLQTQAPVCPLPAPTLFRVNSITWTLS